MRGALAVFLSLAGTVAAADPTFLRRRVSEIAPRAADDLVRGAQGAVEYRPIFGAGDEQARHLKGVARYGELRLGPDSSSAAVSYAAEEQIYYIVEGRGTVICGGEEAALKADDFLYLPPGVRHAVKTVSGERLRLLVMGFKIPGWAKALTARRPPSAKGPDVDDSSERSGRVTGEKLMIANAAEVKPVILAGHGPTAQFQLLMGTTESKRDRLAAANQMASLFIMDFAPGGTNIPHHHETEEEIYYVLRGSGMMVAGGGADGNEGKYPAQAGDAYFFRLNTTVGFYSGAKEGDSHDLVLAVRSAFPFPRRER